MSVALLTIIESSCDNLGDVSNKYGVDCQSLDYEAEAIRCFTSWRKNGGTYADIPIYCMCPSIRVPSLRTRQALEDLGVIYIHEFLEKTDSYVCGYWNVPIGCMYLEKNVSEDLLIHIDLDMYLFKQPPLGMLECSKDKLARLAINEHRPTTQPRVNVDRVYPFEINTGFICSHKSSQFYAKWFDRLERLSSEIATVDIATYSIWEERVCDVMYFDEGVPFEFFGPFQVNEDVSHYSDDEIEQVCFLHGHIGMEANWRPFLESYLRRKNEISRLQKVAD